MSTSVFVMVMNGRKILLVKERAEEIKKENGEKFLKPSLWGLPGGRKKTGGSDIEEAIREVKEETGHEIEINSDVVPDEEIHDGHQIMTFVGYVVGGQLKPQDRDIVDCHWFEILPSDMYRRHQRRIMRLREKLNCF